LIWSLLGGSTSVYPPAPSGLDIICGSALVVDLHWRAHHAAANGRSAVADVPVSLALGAVSIRSLGFVHLCLWPKPQEPGREKPSKIAFPQPPFLEGRPRSPLV
jgi:hypothetical protein